MDIRFQALSATAGANSSLVEWSADCVIVPVHKDKNPLEFISVLLEAAPWVGISPALRDFSGKKNELAMLYGHPDNAVSRILLVGLGNIDSFKLNILRDATAIAVKHCAGLKLERLALATEALAGVAGSNKYSRERLVEEIVLGASLSLYSCNTYRGKQSAGAEPEFVPSSFSLLFAESFVPDLEQKVARKAEAIAEGIIFARDLSNGPANVVNPMYMEKQAEKLASRHGFKFSSYGPDFLQQKGFGAFMAVAQGATAEPRLLVLEHSPQGTENEAPIIFVGKGVTFDSGGISLKPSAGMHEMKTDMSGAGIVLGLFAALGESKDSFLQHRVIGIMPCSENMPDGKAVRPGDVVTSFSGKTVEITNTDAEGRLLLCDALAWAQKEWKPAAIIDIATLTGACVIALGNQAAGLFSNNEKLMGLLQRLGDDCSERLWPLPIWDEDLEGLKSETADLNNTGPREGGALFAALFLKQFIEQGTVWAHLDIAGPARTSKGSPICPAGATAFSLRTLYDFLLAEGL